MSPVGEAYVSPQLDFYRRRLAFHERYRRVYAMLKQKGHSAPKALEVIIDASRGNAYATEWIKMQRRRG